jgi:hypothetical protein
MPNRNIVIAPCGNRTTLFRDSWLKEKALREFDLCLLFYHEEIKHPELYDDVDFFYHLKGFKYHMISELFTRIHPEWLQQYDYFYFPDDDIEIETKQINSLFALSKGFDSAISTASLTKDSFCSWPIFKQNAGCFCRFLGQIEVMAPLFNRNALEICLPTFTGNRSSWGIDAVWSKLLDYPEDKLIVFDQVLMRHTQPVGKGELYNKLGVDPHLEWTEVTRRYGARKENYREYGRLSILNKKHQRIRFWMIRINSFFQKRKRAIHDYDLGSRVKSRGERVLGKSKSAGKQN